MQLPAPTRQPPTFACGVAPSPERKSRSMGSPTASSKVSTPPTVSRTQRRTLCIIQSPTTTTPIRSSRAFKSRMRIRPYHATRCNATTRSMRCRIRYRFPTIHHRFRCAVALLPNTPLPAVQPPQPG
ncbi:hypothetical protein K432DRAFT_196251 [Lepidopterella palustris CBS 459.81]|uniref:Uncharacterized protein n=1 Tax=Lepidopterella palustris CBS 459.81 TaxID=1314670 RepID=A0A8E2EFG4_9PEZI|nr:hypothetical protein K432DRAFT_196251 [Lepidopterella palustris CBS 459.81]